MLPISKEPTMKHFILLFIFTSAFAQDFTGVYHDDVGDLHSFELQPNGILLGELTMDDLIFEVPFKIENSQAYGILQFEDATIGFILTPLDESQLDIQVVPFDAKAQPLAEQSVHYTLTRTENQTAQNPLTVRENPLSQSSSASLNLGGLELYADGSSSESNSASDAHLSGLKEESYLFCSDGSYAYSMSDTLMFSSGGLGDFGGDFSSESTDAHQGFYQVVADALGQLFLQLQATDGRTFAYPISQTAFGVAIDSTEFSASQSSQCQ
jgi:hypothetical protein